MVETRMATFGKIIEHIAGESEKAWVYLPAAERWTLQSDCAVLVSEEVPPDREDDPEAGVPEFARNHNLKQVLPVATLQDIIANAKGQKPNATMKDMFDAFEFYYRNDAFINLRDRGSPRGE